MQRIKDSEAKQSNVQYCIHVQWKLKAEYFNQHDFNDYLCFEGVPNLKTD
jgi:hypothetical protein